MFFVSVASKGFSRNVSLLFATLTGRPISVAAKGLERKVGSGKWTVVSEKNEDPREARGQAGQKSFPAGPESAILGI